MTHATWISIDDRLPESRKTVLLSIEFRTATEDDDGEWHEEHGSVVELGELTPSEDGFYFQAYASHGTHEYMSHWMPLPEPMPVTEAK